MDLMTVDSMAFSTVATWVVTLAARMVGLRAETKDDSSVAEMAVVMVDASAVHWAVLKAGYSVFLSVDKTAAQTAVSKDVKSVATLASTWVATTVEKTEQPTVVRSAVYLADS